jgi:diguanylate cyclase (GGDEF)-like protein
MTLPFRITDDLPSIILETWKSRIHDRQRIKFVVQYVLERAPDTSKLLRAQAKLLQAHLAFREGHMAEALEQSSQAMVVLREHHALAWVARALNVRVCVAAEIGEFALAGASLEEQLRLARESGDLEMEGCALHDLGMMQLQRGPQHAESHLLAALEVFQRAKSYAGVGYAQVNLANVYQQLQQPERAAALLDEALLVAERDGLAPLVNWVRAQQGRLALDQGRYLQAESLLEQALENGLSNNEHDILEIIPSLVRVYLRFDRPERAIEMLEHHLQIVQESGLKPLEMTAHELLAEVRQSLGQDRVALEHYRTHMKLRSQVFNEINEERVRALSVLVRTEVAEQNALNALQQNAELRSTLEQLALAHQHILELSFTDELTKVHNRRFLMTHGETQLREARGRDFTFALLDLDHFKRINDTFGHDAGDRVLCEFALLISNNLRGGDTFARFGGEEFALILPDTTPHAACEVLERIRATMATRVWDSLPAGERITFTAGVTDASDGDLMQALKRADQLLYVGKADGRDRICV